MRVVDSIDFLKELARPSIAFRARCGAVRGNHGRIPVSGFDCLFEMNELVKSRFGMGLALLVCVFISSDAGVVGDVNEHSETWARHDHHIARWVRACDLAPCRDANRRGSFGQRASVGCGRSSARSHQRSEAVLEGQPGRPQQLRSNLVQRGFLQHPSRRDLAGRRSLTPGYSLDRVNTFSLRRRIAKHVIEAGAAM